MGTSTRRLWVQAPQGDGCKRRIVWCTASRFGEEYEVTPLHNRMVLVCVYRRREFYSSAEQQCYDFFSSFVRQPESLPESYGYLTASTLRARDAALKDISKCPKGYRSAYIPLGTPSDKVSSRGAFLSCLRSSRVVYTV